MKPTMRQKSKRQKSTRRKAIRRTYKQVKGGNPFVLNIKWTESSPLFGFFNEKGDSDDVIFDKINTYLDMIQSKIQTYADLTLLMSKLEEADKAINQFKTQRFQTHYHKYNGGNLVLKLRKKAVHIGKSIQKAISGQTEANKGKQDRAFVSRILQERRQERRDNPREYTPPIENEINLPPAPMGQGNKFNRKERIEFNTMMSKLGQKASHNVGISPNQKKIFNEL